MIFSNQIILVLSTMLLVACGSKDEDKVTPPPADAATPNTRSFAMGFTPWLYDATLEAQNDIFSFIDTNADMIAHHMDAGVPWVESLTPNNFDNYGQNVKDEINGKVSRAANMQAKTVYLGVSPFSSLRNAIAPYWKDTPQEDLPAPWNTFEIDNDFVVSAYANYVDELIKKLNPTYVNYAIEINEYYHNRSSAAERLALVYFVVNVHGILKNKYPNIKFMTSFILTDPGSTKMQESAALFDSIKDYMDIVGISVYPYAFFSHADQGDPAKLPANWLSQIKDIAPNKAYFIAETGFVGEDLSIPSLGINVQSDENKQDLYVQKLFAEANKLNIEGIVWYTAYDFDNLWDGFMGDDFSLVWRDTGLKDGNQNPRKALSTWNTWLAYEQQ